MLMRDSLFWLQACYACTLEPPDSYITGCGTTPAAGYVQLPGQVGAGEVLLCACEHSAVSNQ